MNLKILITIALILTISIKSRAQTAPLPQSISLSEAVQLALENNPGQRVKALNVSMSEEATEQARWKKIPDIYANYNLRRNLIIPVTPVPANAFNPNAPEGELIPLKFSTNYTSNIGLNASWDLFNPQNYGQVEVAKQESQISETDQQIAENDLKFTVRKDYSACIIAQKQLQLAVADTVSKNKLLKLAEEKYDAGRIKINELNQIWSDKNTAVSNFFNAQKILRTARAQLLADLGYNPAGDYSFTLTDSFQSLLPQAAAKPAENTQSLSLEKAKQQRDLTEIKLANSRRGFLPTLSLNGFYGANYFENKLNIFEKENWFGNSYVSISLQIPLTQGIDRVKEIDRLKLQIRADQANYRAKQNQIALEKTKAREDLEYRKKDLANKQKNMDLADKNRKTAAEQFKNGRLLAGDLSKSNFQYQQAKTAYLQAAYDYIIAGMQWEKVSRQ